MPATDRLTVGLTRGAEQSGRMVARAGAQMSSQASKSSASGAAKGGGEAPAGAPAAPPAGTEAPPAAPPSGVLAKVAEGIGALTSLEQKLSVPIAKISIPGFPALRVGDTDIGLPHAHSHPPNITPPNPVPVPLPSTGPVISIPFLSGATTTLIENQPAGRCGDMGLGTWCGGFFPMYEVFFGSASVWIEGARQSRMGMDLTKHCIFTAPRPSDPPLGPMFGTTVTGAKKTLVGGVPMPSLTALAMGAAFKGLFKGAGAIVNRVKARAVLSRFKLVTLMTGDEAFQKAVQKDLNRIARTPKGRQILDDIARSGQSIEFVSPRSSATADAAFQQYGPHCRPLTNEGHVKMQYDPNGPYLAEYADGNKYPTSVADKGAGTHSEIVYDPDTWDQAGNHPGSPSDVVAAHELNHARNNALGEGKQLLTDPDPNWNHAWTNHEEHNTVAAENEYRAQRGGVPQRKNYRKLP